MPPPGSSSSNNVSAPSFSSSEKYHPAAQQQLRQHQSATWTELWGETAGQHNNDTNPQDAVIKNMPQIERLCQVLPPFREKAPKDVFVTSCLFPFSGQKNRNYFGAIMLRSGLG